MYGASRRPPRPAPWRAGLDQAGQHRGERRALVAGAVPDVPRLPARPARCPTSSGAPAAANSGAWIAERSAPTPGWVTLPPPSTGTETSARVNSLTSWPPSTWESCAIIASDRPVRSPRSTFLTQSSLRPTGPPSAEWLSPRYARRLQQLAVYRHLHIVIRHMSPLSRDTSARVGARTDGGGRSGRSALARTNSSPAPVPEATSHPRGERLAGRRDRRYLLDRFSP